MRRTSGLDWSFRDFYVSMFVVCFALAVLALVVKHKKEELGINAGILSFRIEWTRTSDSDVDLWVKSPDDLPVGYARKSGKECNLVRDDLGRSRDVESHNYENTICRGTVPGEWAVNCMTYRVYDGKLPVTCRVVVTLIKGSKALVLLDKKAVIDQDHEELTVARFTLDDKGNLVPGSINDLEMPMFYNGARH